MRHFKAIKEIIGKGGWRAEIGVGIEVLVGSVAIGYGGNDRLPSKAMK
jgi:hypothetical protein